MPLPAWKKQLAPALSNLCSLMCQSTVWTPQSLFLRFPRRSPFKVTHAVSPADSSPQCWENNVPGWLYACRCWCTFRSGSTHKIEALVGPVVIQEVRSPHVMRVLHLSDLYTLQGWSIGGASSDTGGEVSSCHADAISIWSLYATRMEHWWGQ